MAKQNHYEVLNLPKTASTDEVKTAYRKLAKQWHPDRFPEGAEKQEAEEKFQALTEAYNTLSDETLRRRYDEGDEEDKVTLENLSQSDQAKLFFHNGVQQFKKEAYAEAADYFSQAAKLQPEVAKYHSHVGLAFSKIPAKYKEAVEAYEKAFAIEPYKYSLLIDVGRIYKNANMPLKAKKKFEEVLRWDKGNPTAQQELLEVYELLGQKRPKTFLDSIASVLKKKV